MTRRVTPAEIPAFPGADPAGKWAVLNCSVTQILGTYTTEARAKQAAEWFGNASFPYELTTDETAQKGTQR